MNDGQQREQASREILYCTNHDSKGLPSGWCEFVQSLINPDAEDCNVARYRLVPLDD